MHRPASASDRGWRNNAVHREVDNRYARWVIRLVLGASIALAPLAVYLLRTMSYVETIYAIEALRVREAQLIDAERRLTIEKAVMESLPAVEQRASTELGLEHPNAARVVVISQEELGRPARSEMPPHRPPSR